MEDKIRVGSLGLSINRDEAAFLVDEKGDKVAVIMMSPNHKGHRIQVVIKAPVNLKIFRGAKE